MLKDGTVANLVDFYQTEGPKAFDDWYDKKRDALEDLCIIGFIDASPILNQLDDTYRWVINLAK